MWELALSGRQVQYGEWEGTEARRYVNKEIYDRTVYQGEITADRPHHVST